MSAVEVSLRELLQIGPSRIAEFDCSRPAGKARVWIRRRDLVGGWRYVASHTTPITTAAQAAPKAIQRLGAREKRCLELHSASARQGNLADGNSGL
jgi:hypothetical protein